MAIRVRVATEAAPAAVLSYPRAADPVFGADFTEVARVPPLTEQEFLLDPGNDLLITELPVGGSAGEAVEAGGCAPPIIAGACQGEAESEAA